MLTYMLQGNLAGHFVSVADSFAERAFADGWATQGEIAAPPPWETPPLVDRFAPLPDSYNEWVEAGSPAFEEVAPEPPAQSPTLSSLNPSSGDQNAAASVTITGTGFLAGATALVNGGGVDTTFNSATELVAAIGPVITANPGALTVTVNNNDGTAPSNALVFTVNEVVTPRTSR
jgi:hypothetical protein